MPPRLPAWFLALPAPLRLVLGCLLFGITYFIGNQVGFSHWGVAAWIPFVAFWLLPYRYWPALVVTQVLVGITTGILVTRVSGGDESAFLGYWAGAPQFFMGNFVNPITNMIGPWVMLRARVLPWARVTPRALGWLHVAAIANFVPPVIKDIVYVLYEGRVGVVRHNVRGGYVGLGGAGDWRVLGEFALSHLLGGFVGLLITVPLAMWWMSRRKETDNRGVLLAGLSLLPVMAAYVALAWLSRGSGLSEMLRLLLMAAVIVFSMRYGWRGAALSVFATSVAIAMEDHLGGGMLNPVWLQLFVAIVGALALLFGSALDELRRRNEALDAASRYTDALARHLQSVASRNVAAEERERKRLAADLHDEFGQTLVALQTQLTRTLPVLERNGMPDVGAALQDSADNLRRHIVSTLDSLRPASLDALGLFGALDGGALRALASRAGLTYQVDLRGDARLLSGLGDATRMAAYRLVQSTLSNTIRHADASHCLVRLRIEQRHGGLCLLVTVDDDGRGRVESLRPHHGLLGLDDRIVALGGVFHIRNLPQGLRVHALLREPPSR